MGVQANPVRVENDHEQTRVLIDQLDRDASLLRNRSQITPKTRARIDALMSQSRALTASLPATAPHRADQIDTEQARFLAGHALYLRFQAPALSRAQIALNALLPCILPPALERDVIDLISNLDSYTEQMRTYTPSKGVPPNMQRLLLANTL